MRKKQMLLQPHRFPSLLHLNSPPFSLFQFHLMTTSISGEALQPQDLSAPTMKTKELDQQWTGGLERPALEEPACNKRSINITSSYMVKVGRRETGYLGVQ
ncbi:hypothetical protein GBAR_LOCUS3828 [Geodia barretti]|uniref:Uncharacterized protein n=1 Tax=Geodia barretti TaxID=519541 RepID=A0AA35W1J9_GEOBA|nr:hypothetical protein GBAR_LOCUS3828 [Geodia barretti]